MTAPPRLPGPAGPHCAVARLRGTDRGADGMRQRGSRTRAPTGSASSPRREIETKARRRPTRPTRYGCPARGQQGRHVQARHAAQARRRHGLGHLEGQSTFELLRVGEDLYLKADADFWATSGRKGGEEPARRTRQAAGKLDGKYVKVPPGRPRVQAAQRLHRHGRAAGRAARRCTASSSTGDRGRSAASAPSRSPAARARAARSTSRWRASRIRCGCSAAGGAGTLDARRLGQGLRAARPREGRDRRLRRRQLPTDVSELNRRAASRPPVRSHEREQPSEAACAGGSGPASRRLRTAAAAARPGSAAASSPGRQRRRRQRVVRQRPVYGRPRGSSRSTRHSRAQRSVIGSASGAFSRLPLARRRPPPTPRSAASSSHDRAPSRRPAGRPCPCCAR